MRWPTARRMPGRHFNLLDEYDFPEEKLRDGMGIRLPKLMN
jgi:hypothetical protein